MQKNNIKLSCRIISALVITVFALFTFSSDSHAAVGLVYFSATEVNSIVELEWETGYEDGTGGFVVRRNGSSSNLSVVQNGATVTFIPGIGDSGFGSIYMVQDPNVAEGQTYTYDLYEITNTNSEIFLETVQITLSSSTSQNPIGTNTPAPTITRAPSTQPTITPIPSATATPGPTATTARAAASPTPQPSATASTAGGTQGVEETEGETTETTSPLQTAVAGQPYPPPGEGGPSEGEQPAITEFSDETSEALPAPDDGAENSDDAYPAGSPQSGNSEPSDTIAENVQSIGSGASGTGEQAQPAEGASNPQNQEGSSVLLWVGFGVAIVIFIGGILGSILLFTKQSQS